MVPNLEHVLNGNGKTNYKSRTEHRIAYFLRNNQIRYQYEPGTLINSENKKTRIWYPDFYLPDYGVYLEYYGLAGKKDYNNGIKTKEAAYKRTGLDVIPMYPWMLTENWQGYLMNELKRTALRRYKNLISRPYWSQRKSIQFNHSRLSSCGYHQGFKKRY